MAHSRITKYGSYPPPPPPPPRADSISLHHIDKSSITAFCFYSVDLGICCFHILKGL